MAVEIQDIVLSAGAIGTAAYGIMDGLKATTKVASFGFGRLKTQLEPFAPVFEVAYGTNYLDILKLYYSKDRASEVFMSDLRQAVRLGLSNLDGSGIARIAEHFLHMHVDVPQVLGKVASDLQAGKAPDDRSQTDFARLEALIMSRLEAGAAAAENGFKGQMRASAIGVAMVLTGLGALTYFNRAGAPEFGLADFGLVVLVGLVAVPIAPVAKDVASGIRAGVRMLRARG